MSERIDIREPVKEICRRLGLDPSTVKRIEFTPQDLSATVYALNENGHKFIDKETGIAPTHDLEFEVTA